MRFPGTSASSSASGWPGARYFAELEMQAVRRRELLAGTCRHGGYTYFTVHEPKERLIAPAAFRDRVVHHAIGARTLPSATATR